MQPSQDDIMSGQAIYTERFLPLYDLIVTRISNLLVWQCPRKTLINFFKENTTTNHLDIGVGTGYFLRQLNLTPGKQRIGLLDLNKHCLDYAKKTLQQFNPEIYQNDIFQPLTIKQKFDSISMNYLLHCLPGTLSQKAIAFDHIKSVLNPGGKIFGTTILGQGVNKNFLARKLMPLYNDKKILSNMNDSLDKLVSELRQRFTDVDVKTKGCVALFVAR